MKMQAHRSYPRPPPFPAACPARAQPPALFAAGPHTCPIAVVCVAGGHHSATAGAGVAEGAGGGPSLREQRVVGTVAIALATHEP